MLLTITSTSKSATDLGYLLHKNPSSHFVSEVSFGTVHVVYPEATDDICTAALVVDVDPISLARAHRGPSGGDSLLAQYINDRPYCTSSLMSVALSKAFSTAMGGRSKERPDLVDLPVPLEVHMPATSCRQGEQLVRRLFEPLGYFVDIESIPLDEQFATWGNSDVYDVTLKGKVTVKSLLSHLYVLLPVLDDEKHYWVGPDEVEKLFRHGEPWLSGHTERELITRSYLRYDRELADQALDRLMDGEVLSPSSADSSGTPDPGHEAHSLSAQRIQAVLEVLRTRGVRRIIDVGCGEGRLLGELLSERGVECVIGVDVSSQALKRASRRLHLETMTPRQRSRIELLYGSATYRDRRLLGFEATVVVEVIEHLDPSRLGAFERNIFGYTRSATVIVTTPNAEYNALYPYLGKDEFRHRDHRFEWTRIEFSQWAQRVADDYGYSVSLSGIGSEDLERGAPTQMAVFAL